MAAVELMSELADVLELQFELPGRVYLYNQPWTIPPDEGLFLVLGILASRPFGSSIHYETADDGSLEEVQGQQTQETYTVTLFSRDASARQRRQEVVFAFNSTAAQQLAEKLSFKFGILPTAFVDVSTTEGSAMLNRYVYTFNVLRAYERRRRCEYFTQFQIPPKTLIVNP